MNNYEKIKQKHNHFGELCCWFSNGHKCTHPCTEHCGVYEKINYYENIEDEIFEKETEILNLEMMRDSLNTEILQWLKRKARDSMSNNDCTTCRNFNIETCYGVCDKNGILNDVVKNCKDYEEQTNEK